MFKSFLCGVLRCVDWLLSTEFAGRSAWGRNGFAEYWDSPEAKPQSQFDKVLAGAECAWDLPRTYFREMLDRPGAYNRWEKYPSVTAPGGRCRPFNSQCPLTWIACGTHDSYSQELRDRLWADPRYRQAVAHVFSKVPEEEALAVAARMDDGYNGPNTRCIERAAQEGLFGCKPSLSEWMPGKRRVPVLVYDAAMVLPHANAAIPENFGVNEYW